MTNRSYELTLTPRSLVKFSMTKILNENFNIKFNTSTLLHKNLLPRYYLKYQGKRRVDNNCLLIFQKDKIQRPEIFQTFQKSQSQNNL